MQMMNKKGDFTDEQKGGFHGSRYKINSVLYWRVVK
jgi:hypothetical protein